MFIQRAILGGGTYNWRECCISKLAGLDLGQPETLIEYKRTAIPNPNSPWTYVWKVILIGVGDLVVFYAVILSVLMQHSRSTA